MSNIFKLIFFLMILYLILYNINTKEYFKMTKCQQCSYLSKLQCLSCSNCGYCINRDGTSECVSGDVNGPYFKSDCSSWTNKYNMTTNNVILNYDNDNDNVSQNRHYYGNNKGRRSNHHMIN